jgi:hypothetical protein
MNILKDLLFIEIKELINPNFFNIECADNNNFKLSLGTLDDYLKDIIKYITNKI